MSEPSFKDWRACVDFYRRAREEEQLVFLAGVTNVRDEAKMAAEHIRDAVTDDLFRMDHLKMAVKCMTRIYEAENVLLQTVLADTSDIEPEAILQ